MRSPKSYLKDGFAVRGKSKSFYTFFKLLHKMVSQFLYALLPPMPKRSHSSSIMLENTQNYFPSIGKYMSKKSVTKQCFLRHNASSGTTIGCGSFQMQFPSPLKASLSRSCINDAPKGIGISKFFQGKTCFVTGATGFLGKVLLAQMLRTDVNKIFLLINAKSEEDAMNRLLTEIINSELFDYLRAIHGESYNNFMLNKLIPIVGNICREGLGIDEASIRDISAEVDIIVNSAANTTFDERYDTALIANTRGPFEVATFAKKCKNLLILLHVSTTYVNGRREGIILEKPFKMGQSIARETIKNASDTSKILDVNKEFEISLALGDGSVDAHRSNETTQNLKKLGMERANYFGWRNTYEFSKAMGEMMINSTRGEVPVVIIRPSVITSTYKYPFPGWVQGIKVQDPLFVLQGQRMLPGFLGNPGVVLDTIPVDMVVNAMLGAIAKHGGGEIKRDLIVYHVGSSTANPLLLGDMFRYSYIYFDSSPLLDRRGERIKINELTFLDTIEKFTDYTRREIVKDKGSQWLERRCKKAVDLVVQLAMMYEPYTFYDGRFDNGNTQKLVEAMSHQELECFDCNVRRVDWEDYFCNVHMPGLRKHAMKERSTPKLVPSE